MKPQQFEAVKFEAVTPLGGGEFVAATAFDRLGAKYQQLVRFRLDPMGPTTIPTRAAATTTATPIEVDREKLLRAMKFPEDVKWFVIEGLVIDVKTNHILFGVRQVYKKFIKEPGQPGVRTGATNVVYVVRGGLAPDRGKVLPETLQVFRFTASTPKGPQALSDLQIDWDGNYLILTSYENTGNGAKTRDSHAGALYRLTPEEFDKGLGKEPHPLKDPIEFTAKPEGLAVLPEGAAGMGHGVVVVFDDDGDTDDGSAGFKKSFRGYEEYMALYKVIDLDQKWRKN